MCMSQYLALLDKIYFDLSAQNFAKLFSYFIFFSFCISDICERSVFVIVEEFKYFTAAGIFIYGLVQISTI